MKSKNNINIKKILIIFCFSIFVFPQCGENKPYEQKKDNNNIVIKNSEKKTQPEILVLQIIKTIEKKLLPAIVNQYLINTDLVNAKIIDNRTIKFFTTNKGTYFQTKIHLFDTETDKQILCISSFQNLDTLFYNSFYFLERNNKTWTNISLQIIPSFAIQIIEIELQKNFTFRKISPKHSIFSFKCEQSKYGISFSYNKNVCQISKLECCDSLNKKISTTFLEIVLKNNKFEISKSANSNPQGLLSDNELDNARRYTITTKALLESNNVYILDLSGQEISRLPADIRKLKKVQILILLNNNLKELPIEIGELSNLQIIRANSNRIAEIPKELGLLKFLEELSLANNNLKTLPVELYNLKNIRILNLESNKLSKINIEVNNMDKLVSLNLNNNKLTYLPKQIGGLQNLILLNISNNNIKQLPSEIQNLKNLKLLYIENTLISYQEVKRIKKLLPNTEVIY